MKKTFITILVILGIVGYFYLTAKADYSWHEKYIAQKQPDWTLFSQQANVIDPIHVYTFFKSPVVRLGFIDNHKVKNIQNKIYFVNVLWANRDIGGGSIKEEISSYLIDCNDLRTGWNGNESVDENNIDLKKITWDKSDNKDALTTERNMCKKIGEIIK